MVSDCGLNEDDTEVETATVEVDSETEPAGESVVLTETGPGSAQFTGTITLSETDAEGVLTVSEGDTVTVTYIDADDGEGGVDIEVTATAAIDCTAPVISEVETVDVGPFEATVVFVTDEPARGSVRYGESCDALTETTEPGDLTTDHAVQLSGLGHSTSHFYAVDAEDAAGNFASDDSGGACYSFSTTEATVLLADDFDDDYLDPTKWWVRTDIPQGGASVTETDGHVEMVNRGFLNTVPEFDPLRVGPLTVTGTWTFFSSHEGDILKILTRSDGIPSGAYGEAANGVAFVCGWQSSMGISGRGGAVVEPVSASIPIDSGDIFAFEIYDDGYNLRFTLTEIGGEGATATVHTTCSSDLPVDHVTFHNRERLGWDNIAHLDDVVIRGGMPSLIEAYSVARHAANDGYNGGEIGLPIDLVNGVVEPREQDRAEMWLRLVFDSPVSSSMFTVSVAPDPGLTPTLSAGLAAEELNLSFGGTFPIGRYEFTFESEGGEPQTFPVCYIRGDVNCSGDTTGLDLAVIQSPANWMKDLSLGPDPRADINRDGEITGCDLAKTQSPAFWNQPVPPLTCTCP